MYWVNVWLIFSYYTVTNSTILVNETEMSCTYIVILQHFTFFAEPPGCKNRQHIALNVIQWFTWKKFLDFNWLKEVQFLQMLQRNKKNTVLQKDVMTEDTKYRVEKKHLHAWQAPIYKRHCGCFNLCRSKTVVELLCHAFLLFLKNSRVHFVLKLYSTPYTITNACTREKPRDRVMHIHGF